MDNREIDTLIAEKVMGWHIKDKNKGEFSKWFDGDKFICHAVAWYPTISLEKAWRVVEKMQEKGYFEMSSWTNDYHARFTTQDGCGYSGQADTAPMSICLAALKCVGVEAR